MSKPVVFVIGATGNIGYATLRQLSLNYSDEIRIIAGVRNLEKAEKLRKLDGVEIVQADMGKAKGLSKIFNGVDVLFIVTPPTDNKEHMVVETAKEAKEANVKHLLVVSVPLAEKDDTIFGRQYSAIENSVANIGLPYTFVRLPFFMENFSQYHIEGIKSQSTIMLPLNPNKPIAYVAVKDAAKASAEILRQPQWHANKIYDIVSDLFSFKDATKVLSEVMGKEITFTQIQYNEARLIMLSMGLPEWITDALLSYYKLVDEDDPVTNKAGDDFKVITHNEPTDFSKWVTDHAQEFSGNK